MWPVYAASPAPFASLLPQIKRGMTRSVNSAQSCTLLWKSGFHTSPRRIIPCIVYLYGNNINCAILWNDCLNCKIKTWVLQSNCERDHLKSTRVHAQSVCCKTITSRVRNLSKTQSKGLKSGAWWHFQDHGQVPGRNSCSTCLSHLDPKLKTKEHLTNDTSPIKEYLTVMPTMHTLSVIKATLKKKDICIIHTTRCYFSLFPCSDFHKLQLWFVFCVVLMISPWYNEMHTLAKGWCKKTSFEPVGFLERGKADRAKRYHFGIHWEQVGRQLPMQHRGHFRNPT